jgi:hypothetical protein
MEYLIWLQLRQVYRRFDEAGTRMEYVIATEWDLLVGFCASGGQNFERLTS